MKISVVLLLLFVSLCILQGAWAKKKKDSNPLHGADPEDAVRTPEVEAFLITGEGSGAIGRQLKEWAGSFSTVYFDMASRLVYYQSAVNYETDIPYIVNRTLEFMSTERYDNKTIQREYPQLKQFPFATQPIVFTYNVPNFLGYVVDRYSESLVMDPVLLADIYMGRVTNWNDTRIRELNPSLAYKLPNMTITPVGYFGRETSTFFLSDAFRQLSPRFGKAFPEPFADWPRDSPNVNPNLVTFFLGAGPLAYVQNTPGSIGYMPFYYFRTGGAGTGPYVLVKYNDEILLPNKTTVLSMFKNARVAHSGRVEGFDYKNGTAGWPFTAVSYVHLVENSPVAKTKCEKDRLMLKFFRWIQKDETADIQSASNGIYMLPENIRNEVVHRLERLVCWGEKETLLAVEIINDHDNAYFEALLALAMALMAVLAPPGLYIAFARNTDGKLPNKVASVYTFIVVAGACTVYCSVIFFYLVPDENWVCQLRVWLTGVGYAVFLGAMFTRTFQYYRIFLMSKKSHIPDTLRRGNLTKRAIVEILFSVGTVTVLQVAVLIAWSVSDPLKAELSTIDDIERTASWVCKSDSVWLWIGLEIGFFMILLFYGLFVVFRTWDAKARFADSKWVLMAIYNMIIILAAMVPLFVILVIKDDNLFILATVAITFTVSTTLLAVYMPKAGARIERMVQRLRGRSSETSHSKSTTATARSTTRTNNASSKSGSTEDS